MINISYLPTLIFLSMQPQTHILFFGLIKHINFLQNCIEQFMVHSTSSLDVALKTNTYTYTYTQNFKTYLCAKLKS